MLYRVVDQVIDYKKLYGWGDGLYSYLFPLRVAGAQFGRRMIVVRSQDERLMLVSPLRLPDSLRVELASLGEIDSIVIPTRFHDTGIRKLNADLLSVNAYGSKGLERLLPGLRSVDTLPDRWNGALKWQLLEGMPKVNEVVLCHVATKTLLPSDLLFHFSPSFSRWTRILAKVSGAYPGYGPTRLFRSLIDDRDAFEKSIRRVLAWDFERVLPSHAEPIERGGREALEACVE